MAFNDDETAKKMAETTTRSNPAVLNDWVAGNGNIDGGFVNKYVPSENVNPRQIIENGRDGNKIDPSNYVADSMEAAGGYKGHEVAKRTNPGSDQLTI